MVIERIANVDTPQITNAPKYAEIIPIKKIMKIDKESLENSKKEIPIVDLNKENEVKLVIGFGLNITDRKQIEDKLLLNEKRYRDLFNYSQALICTHDLEGKLLSVNPAICSIIGYTSEELIGRNIKEFVPQDKISQFDEQYLQNVLTTGKAEGVFIIICKRKSRQGGFLYCGVLFSVFYNNPA